MYTWVHSSDVNLKENIDQETQKAQKNNANLYSFNLFTCGGPCHLSSVLGTLFSSENSLFIHLWSLYYHLFNIVNIEILLQNYIMPL